MTLLKGSTVGDGSPSPSYINGSEPEVGSNDDRPLPRAADVDDVSIQSVKWLVDDIASRIFSRD